MYITGIIHSLQAFYYIYEVQFIICTRFKPLIPLVPLVPLIHLLGTLLACDRIRPPLLPVARKLTPLFSQ